MRRARIRLQIAKAILIVLPVGHKLSLSNVRRYVTRDFLTVYNIRRDTPIHQSDWVAAISVARAARAKTISAIGHDRELLRQRRQKNLYKELKKLRKTPPSVSTGTSD